MAATRSTFGILTRLFLGRFFENDLISPGSDRHATLAIATSVLISLSIFVAFFLTTKYLAQFILLPGPTAVSALSDRFFLIAFSMAVTALVTLLLWDALGLEPRDGAILGPLPLPASIIARAKLAALLAFAAGFSLLFNTATSMIYPLLMTDHFHLPGRELLRVMAAHAASVMLASAFAFLVVFAMRGLLEAIAGERWFGRLSSLVQTALIVIVTSTLLLLPTLTADVSRDWLRADAAQLRRTLPPLWFLGLCETLEGHIVVDTPIVVPRRLRLPVSLRQRNERVATVYRGYDAMFHDLARRAVAAVVIAAAIALATFAWNSRRLPLPLMRPAAGGRMRAIAGRLGGFATARQPAAWAGFGFTLQVLSRSAPHRVAMSAALAFGLTASVVLAQAVRHDGILAAQTAVVGALIAGFRHAARLPAQLPANWVVQMAWRGDQRSFLSGAKRAAMTALIGVPLVAFAPMYVAVIGWRLAFAHAVIDAVAAAALLQTLFVGFSNVPFASPYVPLRNPKLLWPLSYGALFALPWGLAVVERHALGSSSSALALIATLAAAAAAASYASRRGDIAAASMAFEDLPEEPTQRLGLHERMIG